MRRALRLLIASVALAVVSGCGDVVSIPATGTIYGSLVFEGGEPAPDIEVLVEGAELSAWSGPDGSFIINGVLAVDESGMGRYYTVRGRGERDDVSVGFFVDRFKVKGQQAYSVGTVDVLPAGEISGVLRLEGESDHSGAVVGITGSSLQTLTRADGSYLLEGVPAFDGYLVSCARSGWVEMTFEHLVGVDPGGATVLEDAVLHRVPAES